MTTLTSYKRDFQQCEQSLRNSLDHAYRSYRERSDGRAVDRHEFIYHARNVERLRQLKENICKLEQNVWIVQNVLGELEALITDTNNLLVMFHDKKKLSLQNVLDDYLKLIATEDRPYQARPADEISMNASAHAKPRSSAHKDRHGSNWTRQKKGNHGWKSHKQSNQQGNRRIACASVKTPDLVSKNEVDSNNNQTGNVGLVVKSVCPQIALF